MCFRERVFSIEVWFHFVSNSVIFALCLALSCMILSCTIATTCPYTSFMWKQNFQTFVIAGLRTKLGVFLQPVHTETIALSFQMFHLWGAFSKVCVFIENDAAFSRRQIVCVFERKRIRLYEASVVKSWFSLNITGGPRNESYFSIFGCREMYKISVVYIYECTGF